MSDKTGGPAFPVKGMQTLGGGQQVDFVFNSGMTLRDYFAAKAMQSLITVGSFSEAADDAMRECGFVDGEFANFIARFSYKFADAMIKEREK